MDRVNRRFLAASTIIAIPAALLMASLSVGTNPELPNVPPQQFIELLDEVSAENASVVHDSGDSKASLAFAHEEENESGKIQQVVGKQFEVGPRRGIFNLSSNGSTQNRSTQNRSTQSRSTSSRSSGSSQRQGLFSNLFGGRSNSNSSSSRSTPPVPPSEDDVNWDGVPYHSVQGGSSKSGLTRPIRSQSTARSTTPRSTTPRSTTRARTRTSSTQTRTIRGGNAGTPVAAAPTPVKRTRKPTVARKPAPAMQVPSPPADRTVSTAKEFSTESSSRRSRSSKTTTRVDPTDVAAIYDSGSRKTKAYQDEDVVDLVPRVSRKVIRTDVAKTNPKPAAKAAAPKVVAKPAPKKTTPEPKAIAKTDDKPAPEPKAVAKVEVPAKKTSKPAASADVPSPKSIAKATPQPKATLELPTVAKAESSKPAYSTPVDPAKTAVPPAPAEPQVAKADPVSPGQFDVPLPAASVSHRAGPAPSKFAGPSSLDAAHQPIRQPASVQRPAPAYPPATDNFSAIGSGVRQPSQPTQPAYRTAARNPQGYDGFGAPYNSDPYGSSRGYQPSPTVPGRLSTNGQRMQPEDAPEPVGNQPSPRDFVGNRPAHETVATPFRPIPGYSAGNGFGNNTTEERITRRSSSEMPNADDFSAAGTAGNRMRGKKASAAVLPSKGANIVASELPGIRVVTHGPAEVMIRQDNEYEIRVENRGSIDAHGVLVRAMIPDWAEVKGRNASRGEVDNKGTDERELLLWTIDHLPAGTSEQMFVRLVAARSGTYNLDVDWTLVPQKSVAQVRVHEPQLDLVIEGPDQVIYGSSQTYKVRVLNPGDGIAPNVVFTLSPNSATPQSQSIGDIPPGKEAQFEVELTAQDLGDLKIQGLATGDLELRAEAGKTIAVMAANLEAVLAGPELKYQNTPAVYNLQIQNLGSATSERVIATLRIPSGVEYTGGIEGATFQRGTLKWEIQSLPPSGSRDYQFQCNMKSTGEHMFAFDCKGTAAGQAQVAIATRVESISDLVLTINDPPAPAPIGSDVTYEIVVRNRGSREARNVQTIAQFSHGIEPLRVEGQSGEVVTGQVLFDEIPRIGAGETVTLRVIAQAEKAGHHRFRTEVRSGDTVLVAEEATHYMSPRSDRVSRRSSDASVR